MENSLWDKSALQIVLWRWTICFLLSPISCSISSPELIKIWKKTFCEFRKPELTYLIYIA
ncbi:MAG TPA: hypothetical protein PLN24_07880 [Victivallales bacterium]|nr:hypothetical protein [Victivallales bacterium]